LLWKFTGFSYFADAIFVISFHYSSLLGTNLDNFYFVRRIYHFMKS